jgi:hypothetical protein
LIGRANKPKENKNRDSRDRNRLKSIKNLKRKKERPMEDGLKKNIRSLCLVKMSLYRITAVWEELEENIGPCRNKKWGSN